MNKFLTGSNFQTSNDIEDEFIQDQFGANKVSLVEGDKTAFGEVSVANPTPIIQGTFSYVVNTRVYDIEVGSSGLVSVIDNMVQVDSGVDSSSSALLKTKKSARYRAGQGLIARFTAKFPVVGTGDSYQRVGLRNDKGDSLYFGYEGSVFGIRYQNSAGVSTNIPQSSWNKDKGDGLGILPLLDWTKGNIFQVRIQYLGMGKLSFYVADPFTGEFILIHQIEYANSNTVPNLGNPSLGFGIDVSNGSTTPNPSLKISSASYGVFIEGKNEFDGIVNCATSSKTISTTETNILTLKNNDTVFGGYVNTYLVFPKVLSIATIGGTKPVQINLTLNTTLGGTPSFTNIDLNTSIVSFDIAGTTVSGGNQTLGLYLGKEDKTIIDLDKLKIVLGRNDTLTVSAITSSGSVDVFTVLSFLEDSQ